MQSIASCLAFSAHFMQYLVLQEGQVYTSPLISPLWRRQKFSLNFVEGGKDWGRGNFFVVHDLYDDKISQSSLLLRAFYKKV